MCSCYYPPLKDTLVCCHFMTTCTCNSCPHTTPWTILIVFFPYTDLRIARVRGKGRDFLTLTDCSLGLPLHLMRYECFTTCTCTCTVCVRVGHTFLTLSVSLKMCCYCQWHTPADYEYKQYQITMV